MYISALAGCMPGERVQQDQEHSTSLLATTCELAIVSYMLDKDNILSLLNPHVQHTVCSMSLLGEA